jgi:hypothetical protein
MNMHKKSYWLAMALLLAVMTLAACGGGGSTGGESGEAPNVPASDAAAGAQAGGTGTDTGTGDTVTEGANGSNDASGAGDASGGNAGNDAGSATDVGSGSDGAQGSGGSNGASGTTSPESETGAPTEGDAAGNTESGTGTDASGAQGGTAGGAYTAVADGECTEIQGQLTTALGVEVSRATGAASFSDLSGGTGESCQLTITGTGVQFPSIVDAAQRISQVLTENGWTADPQYAADSPTATIGGLRRENQLAAYNVQWSPADGVTCPADQPISACAETLTPDQMNYNITIDLAQQ